MRCWRDPQCKGRKRRLGRRTAPYPLLPPRLANEVGHQCASKAACNEWLRFIRWKCCGTQPPPMPMPMPRSESSHRRVAAPDFVSIPWHLITPLLTQHFFPRRPLSPFAFFPTSFFASKFTSLCLHLKKRNETARETGTLRRAVQFWTLTNVGQTGDPPWSFFC